MPESFRFIRFNLPDPFLIELRLEQGFSVRDNGLERYLRGSSSDLGHNAMGQERTSLYPTSSPASAC